MTTFRREPAPVRNPSNRSHRRELTLEDFRIRALRKDASASLTEIEEAAHEYLASLSGSAPGVDREAKNLSLLSTLPPRHRTSRAVEMATMLRLPEVREFNEALQVRPGSGRPANRRPAISMLWALGGGLHERPCISTAHQALLRDPLLGFALDYPERRPLSSLYELIGSMCEYQPIELASFTNLRLVRLLAKHFADAAGYKPCQVMMVDGTHVPGNFQQRGARSDRERELLYGPKAPRAAFTRYTDSNGQTTKKWAGYRLVSLIEPRLMVCVISRMFPANMDERDACQLLLAELFEMWPDCPLEYLVGDSYFDHGHKFNEELQTLWSVIPVFPSHGTPGAGYAHNATGGVPHCRCGVMARRGHDDFPTLAARRALGLARGEHMTLDKARVRYTCANGIHDAVTVYARDNPSLYTLLPRTQPHGNSTFYAKRVAMLLARNRVESFFASLKNLGLASDGQQRFRSRAEPTLEWILGVGVLALTARSYVHTTGRYAPATRILEGLGLLKDVGASDPAAGPDSLSAERGDQMLRALLESQPDLTAEPPGAQPA